MASGRMMSLILVIAFAAVACADIAGFDDLSLSPQSYWNGSDGSGGFQSGSAWFSNSYTDWGGGYYSWDGWAYSNKSDTTTPGYTNQYSVITGGGFNSENYGISYVTLDYMSGTYDPIPTSLTFTNAAGCKVSGAYFTNTTYSYLAMQDGYTPAKKFGGPSGNDPDWFLLTITGKDTAGADTNTVEFYLADYRLEDNSEDYIVDDWEYVDLSSLGLVKSLEFSLSSSDAGDFGMNNPTYFAMDNLICVPEPATIILLGSCGLMLRRRKRQAK
jgi:hypothetical protein